MKLYRLMCKAEYDRVDDKSPFSWQSKAKWFSDDIEFIKSRVSDGKFNNSDVVEVRYQFLVVYDVTDGNSKLKRVSNKEVMLYRKDAPMIKVNSVNKLGIMSEEW